MTPDGAALARILEAVYDAVPHPDRWPAALDLARAALGARAVALQVSTPARGGRPAAMLRWTSSGLDAALEDRYRAGLPEAEALAPQGLRAPALFAVPHPDERARAALLVYRRESDPAMGADAKALADALVPHVARSLALARRQRQDADDWLTLLHALDRFTTGLLLVDALGRVAWASRVGEAILAAGDGLSRGKDGLLEAKERGDREALKALVADALRSGAGGALALPRGRLTPPLIVIVPRAAPGRTPASEPTIAVIVSDPARKRSVGETLGATFGLTHAEQRVAEALASGLAPKEVAVLLEAKLGTVRTHMKSIFLKLRVGRQADLVRVVSELSTLGA